MNTPLMRWLLDLDTIPEDAESLRLVWEHPWPAWGWLIFVILAAWLAIWSYTRLTGRREGRGVLAVLRAAVVLLVLVLLSGPMIELPREHVEEDWVIMMLDRSASMSIRDADDRRSRDDQLRSIIDDHADVWARLRDEREVRWFGFHAGAYALDDDAATGPALDEPIGARTNLTAALEQALQRAAARPVTGIVLLTDGRTPDPPDRALVRRLQAEAIEVYPVPLGSPDPVGDLAVARVEAPRRAFVRDKVPVVVDVEQFGGARRGATVTLTDSMTGETLDQVEIDGSAMTDQVTLTAEPDLVGEANWVVEIATERADLVPENNRRSITVELIDRPLRVLFIDGYARWEYRFLKNLMVREASIDSSVMLLSADRDFAQEGNAPITRLPNSPEEWAQFDVIVIGDVPATFFSPDQLDQMRNHVADRGAGMLWIGGERHTPESYTGLALADLLPMRGGLNLSNVTTGVNLQPTPLAERLGVLRVTSGGGEGWPEELRDASYEWSRLWFVQRIEPARLKPTAEVLATTVDDVDGAALPLVVHMRYGAGQTIYVATDEIWRWRYGRGEFYPDQFWIQMVRMLGRESLERAGEPAVLDVRPRRVEVGTPARAVLRVLDQELLEAQPPSIRAVLRRSDGDATSEIELRPVPGTAGEYVATVIPDETGSFRIEVDDPTFAATDALVAVLDVFGRDDELRRPETDHDLLARLAAETGGRVLDPAAGDLDDLTLRNREVRTENPLRERIWDTPLFFALLLLLLTAEWIGRKILRLA